MAARLEKLVRQWAEELDLKPEQLPGPSALEAMAKGGLSIRVAALLSELDSWEERHGYELPRGLRVWLSLSDGLYSQDGPLIHPLTSIGPMIPFARVPELVVQPESWYELGNPGIETVCMDLGYQWPEDGGTPIFTSGDDTSGTGPRIIATGFDGWFLRVLREGGRAYWFDRGFRSLGDPWVEHRRQAPTPPLPERLRPLAERARQMMSPEADERRIAGQLGISMRDLEALFRHLQHGMPG